MKKRYLVLTCILVLILLNACGGKESPSEINVEGNAEIEKSVTDQSNDADEKESTNSNKTPPVVDHLDSYPFPVPSSWKEEKFVVTEYDEGIDWEAVFTFEADEAEQAEAYKTVIEDLGYETQSLLNTVFKINEAEFVGNQFHGTFTFDVADEYSEWNEGLGYVEITFSEKK